MDELKDAITAVLYVILFVLIIGFIGWYTEPPGAGVDGNGKALTGELAQPHARAEPQVRPTKERYLHGARAL